VKIAASLAKSRIGWAKVCYMTEMSSKKERSHYSTSVLLVDRSWQSCRIKPIKEWGLVNY